MKNKTKASIITACAALTYAVTLHAYQAKSKEELALDTEISQLYGHIENTNNYESRCSGNATIDKVLLQNRWYYDKNKKDFGVIFYKNEFVDHSLPVPAYARYCIEEDTAVVTFYEYIIAQTPGIKINMRGSSQQVATLPVIHMKIEELTENRLIISWYGGKEKLTLYR